MRVCVDKSHMYAHSDCCEAMHACACCVCGMNKAHAHGDCCEAMHACVRVCVSACTRRMLTVIAARRGKRVLFCMFLRTRRMVTVIAARRCMRVLVFVCSCAQGACSLWWLRGDTRMFE
jgi:hypothetical protein